MQIFCENTIKTSNHTKETKQNAPKTLSRTVIPSCLIIAVPHKVEQLIVESVTSTSVSLSWTKVEGSAEVTYNASWRSNEGSGQLEAIKESSTKIKNLTSNTLYIFTITAVNHAGRGDASEEVEAITRKDFYSCGKMVALA